MMSASGGSEGAGLGGGKSDTSSRAVPIKNPLLSMQVTGLTLDDFAHNTMLLPAAPPSTLLPPAPTLEVSREPETTDIKKPIVFSPQLPGAVPELPDPDSFSEIDLHSTADSLSNAPTSAADYNPLQDLDELELKSNEPNSYLQQTSAITAQFAAQLPNVASTVFSTFSRVIKGTSPGPQQNPSQAAPAPVEQVPIVQAAYDYSQQHFAQDASFTAEHQQCPPPPPPTFFNPETLGKPGPTQPPVAAQTGSNSYRLGGSKKKTYAHIPGLSSAGPPPTVVAPVQNQEFNQFASFPEPVPTSQPTSQDQIPKSGFSFFEKLPTLLDKIPKPPFVPAQQQQQSESVPSPVNYFGGPAPPLTQQTVGPQVSAFCQPLPPPPIQTAAREEQVSFTNSAEQQVAPPAESTSLPPPPTFFTPAQIPTVPNLPQNQAGKNPYSSSRLSKGVGLYKNPLAPPAPATVPTFLPNQEPPRAGSSTAFFQPPLPESQSPFEPNSANNSSQPPLPIQFFNPSAPVQATQLRKPPTPILQRASEPPSTGDTGIVTSRPESSLSESLNRKSNRFAPFEEDSQSEAKTILDSRSKSSENVLSPPPRPNSNLSEPALFSEGQPINLFRSDAYGKAPELETLPPPPPAIVNNCSSATSVTQQASIGTIPEVAFFNPVQIPQQSPGEATAPPPAVVNYFNPVQIPQQPLVGSSLPLPPTAATLGSKQYHLQKTRRSAYAIPPSLATSTVAPPAFNVLPVVPPAIPVQQPQLFNQPVSTAQVTPTTFFNPTLSAQQPLSSTVPVSYFNPTTNEPDHPPSQDSKQRTAPTSFFNPIAASDTTQDSNANPIQQPVVEPISAFAPVPVKPTVPQQDINSNPVSNTTSNFFSIASSQPQPSAPIEDLNANFFELQIANQAQPIPLANPLDFFNSTPSTTTTKTGQTQSQVQFFNFYGHTPQAVEPEAPPPIPVQPTLAEHNSSNSEQALASSFFAGQDNVDGGDQDSTEQCDQLENDEQPVSVIEPDGSDSGGDQGNSVHDNQLDDRYDDPTEQVRIGNAPEPIFSSDNLFEFKRSAFEDDTYSKDVLIDANSSSMAAMTATATGPTGGGASAVVDSSMASISETTNIAYRPIYRHWFFKREVETKVIWTPFSMSDSLALEDALPMVKEDDDSPMIVHVDGGRHDVSIKERKMVPVYWKGPSQEVRRCSWFYKNVDSRFVPYEEEVSELLEREYKEAATSGEWHRRVTLPNGETVVFHGPSVIVHFLQTQNPDSWGGTSPVPSTTNRPRVVKRGVDEFNIEDGEPERIDHLLFMVHGIGEFCDLKFRLVEEVVDEFRSISAQLVQSHYRSSFDRGDIGRVEVLPISWHNDLHSEESGVDKKLKAITLESIPKLRNFTNDTVLDVLFYTSPVFCQNIIDAVGNSINRLYSLFLQRNPNFTGGVSLAGHSLGSLILFDLLCHQKPQPMETENSENPDGDKLPALFSSHPNLRRLSRTCSKQINYEVGPAGTGQPFIAYPQLVFHPTKFFALGSPIGMFVTVRGIDALGLDFKLPTCEGFYNIFHPYDPVAYRIEALINPDLSSVRPVLIPHHKGRKRMHLELKETMLRVGMDLKQKVLDTFRNTLDAVFSITSLNRPDRKAIEHEVDKVIEDQLKFETGSSGTTVSSGDLDTGETDLPLGELNKSRRVDYVLQEAPLEFINEYLFALTSHVCYWESEDTMLFLMKEIYSSMGIQSDSQIPQQSLTIERPIASPAPSTSSQSNYNLFPQQQQSGDCNR